MVRCKIKGTGKNRQGSPKPTKKPVRKPSVVLSPTTTAAVELPPSTPVQVEHSSSSSEDTGSSISTPEEQDYQPYEVHSASNYVSSFPNDDDEGLINDDQSIEQMVFFEGSPFHLLEPEPMGPISHDGMPTALSQPPCFPHSSFRADIGMPRMKLQPRLSSHNGLTNSDFLAGCLL